jgi:hypothetical protein
MAEVLPQANYKMRIYDQAGDFAYEIQNFLPLSYSMRVNAPGLLTFSLSAEHELTSQTFDKWQVEIWRKPDGEDWSRDFVALIRKDEWSYKDTALMNFTCPGWMQMLAWKHILYPSKTTDRTLFTDKEAETICNTLVKYNATSSGTTGDGRDRDAANGYPFTGLSVEADGGDGNVYSGGFYCARKNLLETLQDLAKLGGGDFDIVKTSSTAWQWRWYEGQLGTDRSSDVVFSMFEGNMANPIVANDRIGVKTVALVGGAGVESERETATVTSSDYAAANDIEMFVDAKDVEAGDIDGLESRGDEKLEETRAKDRFTFDVLQSENSQFGVHYFLGDKCVAVNPKDDSEVTVKIVGVAITLDAGGKETIDIETEEV